MEAMERRVYSAGSRSRSSRASARPMPPGTYPPSGSWAEVWSVTRSGCQPRRTSSGSTSAALAISAMLRASPAARQASTLRDRRVQVVGHLVDVAGGVASLGAGWVDLDGQAGALVHGHGQRLRPAHAAQAGGQRDRALQAAVEVLASGLGEGLVGALDDPLGGDVDPASRRSSGRTWSGRRAPARGTAPRSPSGGPGWRWRSGRAGLRCVVRKTPTGLPDWTRRVSSFSSRWSSATMASKASQLRAARPVPP